MEAVLYFVKLSLYALVMWAIYCAVFRNKPLHSYSRAYLLASLVMPIILPFVHLPAPAPVADYAIVLSPVSVTADGVAGSAEEISWLDVLSWLYVGGCSLLATLYVCSYVGVCKRLRKGHQEKQVGYSILTHTGIGPGTLGRRIFFPAGDVDGVIVRHELAHIRAGHRYDSFLLQLLHIACWVSPAHWLIGKELKTVHEFEADRLACNGINASHYVSILLSQSFGIPYPLSITHSFFCHPLKRRITMLQKTKAPKRGTLLLTALLLTTCFLSTVFLAQARKGEKTSTAVAVPTPARSSADRVAEMRAVVRNYPPMGEVSVLPTGAVVFRTVDQMPELNNGMRTYEWLGQNQRYPLAARAQKLEGYCHVQFIVDANGNMSKPQLTRSSGHHLLDEEAMRLVSSMPGWKPGVHHGRAVPVAITVPVYFSLSGNGC